MVVSCRDTSVILREAQLNHDWLVNLIKLTHAEDIRVNTQRRSNSGPSGLLAGTSAVKYLQLRREADGCKPISWHRQLFLKLRPKLLAWSEYLLYPISVLLLGLESIVRVLASRPPLTDGHEVTLASRLASNLRGHLLSRMRCPPPACIEIAQLPKPFLPQQE